MAALTSASLGLIVYFLICSSEALENITAEVGQDVILPCKDPNNINITAVKWRRPEIKTEYVAFYRDGHLDPDSQHPSYQNRVDLQDRKMKDGNASLILKNVTKEDIGRYECQVFQEGTNRIKRSSSTTKTTYIIDLEVVEPGHKDGFIGDGEDKFEGDRGAGDNVGIIVGSVVGVILLLAVLASVGFLIYKQLRRQNQHRPVPMN